SLRAPQRRGFQPERSSPRLASRDLREPIGVALTLTFSPEGTQLVVRGRGVRVRGRIVLLSEAPQQPGIPQRDCYGRVRASLLLRRHRSVARRSLYHGGLGASADHATTAHDSPGPGDTGRTG